MKQAASLFGTQNFRLILWIALAFGLTSAVYLVWLDRLVLLAGPDEAERVSLIAGYLFQAAGLFITYAVFKRSGLSRVGLPDSALAAPLAVCRQSFCLCVILFAVLAVPTLLTRSVPAVIIFGLLMNLLCGVIAGFYLAVICRGTPAGKRSTVFGGGYAIATVGAALLAAAYLMRGGIAVLVCLILAGALLWTTRIFDVFCLPDGQTEKAAFLSPAAARGGKEMPLLSLACLAIVLISLVKNLGFNFPTADIQAGLVPEIARIPYAAGLLAAGFINDRSRRNGFICSAAALIIPFLMLGLMDEPISSMVFWGLNYIFYAFFSVFRVVIIMDIADLDGERQAPLWYLAPLGLLFGRIGDAAGSGIGLALSGHHITLIALCAALFILAVFVLYRLYERCFMPKAAPRRSEKEVFGLFCMHNDLSFREQEVLRLLLAGQANGQISEALFISENTVKYHVKNILKKTGCKNRGDLQTTYMQALYPADAEILPAKACRDGE